MNWEGNICWATAKLHHVHNNITANLIGWHKQRTKKGVETLYQVDLLVTY